MPRIVRAYPVKQDAVYVGLLCLISSFFFPAHYSSHAASYDFLCMILITAVWHNISEFFITITTGNLLFLIRIEGFRAGTSYVIPVCNVMTGRKKGGSDSVLRQAKDELYQSYLKRDL